MNFRFGTSYVSWEVLELEGLRVVVMSVLVTGQSGSQVNIRDLYQEPFQSNQGGTVNSIRNWNRKWSAKLGGPSLRGKDLQIK